MQRTLSHLAEAPFLTQHNHANPANPAENEIVESIPQTESRASVLAAAVAFVRQQYARLLLISAAVLAPVFWHRNIAAGDLGSHLYNAWLAQLIRHGYAPGLWLAPRWNNALFDLLLGGSRPFRFPARRRKNCRVARRADFLLGHVRASFAPPPDARLGCSAPSSPCSATAIRSRWDS